MYIYMWVWVCVFIYVFNPPPVTPPLVYSGVETDGPSAAATASLAERVNPIYIDR